MRKVLASEIVSLLRRRGVAAEVAAAMAASEAMLLGRVTYEEFAAFWPSQEVTREDDEVGGGSGSQLGLLRTIGSQKDRGRKDAHWVPPLLKVFIPYTYDASRRPQAHWRKLYSPKCVEGALGSTVS